MGQTSDARATDLDNPVWHALGGPHRHLAHVIGETRWYPDDIAPFVSIPHPDVVPALDAAAAGGLKGPCYFVGTTPVTLPDGWEVLARSRILQLLPVSADPEPSSEDDIRLLGAADAPRMKALMQIGFPDFFRERTAELGEYLGIADGPALVGLAGERLALAGWQEISGVCTHPRYVGRGYARRLTQALMRRQRRRGVRSFLHVSEENTPARRLYASMGFVERAGLRLAKIARRPA